MGGNLDWKAGLLSTPEASPTTGGVSGAGSEDWKAGLIKPPLPTGETLQPSPFGTLTQRAAKPGTLFGTEPRPIATEEEKAKVGTIEAPPDVTLPGPHGVPIHLSDTQIQAMGKVFAPGFDPNAHLFGGTAPIINPERGLFAPAEILTDKEKRENPFLTGLGQSVEGLTTPGGISLLAATAGVGGFPSIFKAATSAYFYDQMVKGMAEAGTKGWEEYKKGNTDEAKRLFGNAFGSGVMGAFAGYHGIKEGGAAFGEGFKPFREGMAAFPESPTPLFSHIETEANRRMALLNSLPPERQAALLQKMGFLPEEVAPEEFALPEAARAPGGKLQLGADVGRLSQILGGSMYTNRGAPVVVKELLQNAMDAVRGNGGAVRAIMNDDARTFTLKDEGVGMTPDQVFTVFSDIGSSGKATQAGASGGFGLAKIAPFMIPERMEVDTVALAEDGSKYRTTFTSTPEDIIGGTIEPKVSKVKDDAPTGTTIKTYFPPPKEGDYDPNGFYAASRFLKDFFGSSNLPTKEFSYHKEVTGYDQPIDMATSHLSVPNFRIYSNAPGGEFRINYSPEMVKGSGTYVEFEVHNNGLYQFKTGVNIPGSDKVSLPARMAVDISPNVHEGDASYPFTTNRETLTKQATDFLTRAISKDFVADKLNEANNLIKAKYNNMPSLYGTGGESIPIYDSGARLTPEEVQHIQEHPAMRDIGSAIHKASNDLLEIVSEFPASVFGSGENRPMGNTIDRIGLLLADYKGEPGQGQRTYGVYVPNPSRTGSASVFINPFGWANLAHETAEKVTQSPKGLGPNWYYNPDIAASAIYHTIMHEVVHDVAKGHNESFTSAMGHLDALIGTRTRLKGMEGLANAFADPDNPDRIRADFGDLLSLYRESRKRPETEKDILGGESFAAGGKQPEPRGEVPPASNAPERGEEDIRPDRVPAGGGAGPEGPGVPGPQPEGAGRQAAEGAQDPLQRSVRELQAILPRFTEEVGGERGTTEAGEATREGAAVGEPPPPTHDEIELGNGGIHMVPRGADMWWTGRFLGGLTESARLLNQQGHPLGPTLVKISSIMSDTAKAIARDQGEIIKDWKSNAKRLVSDKEWEDQVVPLLDNPQVTPTSRPANVPDNVWKAYEVTRAIDDRLRIGMRDAMRQRLTISGVDPARANQWVPDDWGMTSGHYPHAFPGDFTITRAAGVNPSTGEIEYEPITTGWRAANKWEAQAKAREWLAAHPGDDIKIDRDTFTLPGKDVSDRSKLFNLSKSIKDADSQIAGGATPEDVLKALYDESAAAAFGPKRLAPRQFSSALARESNLPGWAKDMDNFERYLYGATRFIHMTPARESILTLRNGIAELSGMPTIQRPSDIPSVGAYSSARQFGNILARVDAAIEGLEGRPGFSDAYFRRTLGDLGFDPNLANKVQRPIQMLAALTKLGFNPARVLSHGLQTLWAVYPVLGELSTLDGMANAYNPKYDHLIKDLAVSHGTSSNDIEGFRSYMADYFGRGTKPIDWAKGTGAIIKEVGMFPFATGIDFTRRVAAVGAYIDGLERKGMTPERARDYARSVMDRTAGEYSAADNSSFTRQLPGTVAQFKNFMLKTSQFMWGLRTPGEIARFIGATAVLGFSGMAFLRAMSNLVYNTTGVDIEGALKRKFPVSSRGIFGLMGVDIPAGVGLADLSITRENVPLGGILGPAASDAIALTGAGARKLFQPYSREGQQAIDDALRNLSPAGRRLWDEAARITGGKGSLVDPHTDSIILRDLTKPERIEQMVGLSPLRVAQERDFHAYIRHEIEAQKDKKGFFVDKLAGLSINSGSPELSIEDRAQAQADIFRYLKVIQDEYPELGRGLAKAVKDRARTMQQERLERDIRKAPRNLRPEFYQEYLERQRGNP